MNKRNIIGIILSIIIIIGCIVVFIYRDTIFKYETTVVYPNHCIEKYNKDILITSKCENTTLKDNDYSFEDINIVVDTT